MIEKHDLFIEPTNKEQKIWRYMDFTKFVELLNSECLFFSRSDKFEDIFEGSYPINSVKRRNQVYAELINQKILNPEYTSEFVSKNAEKNKKNHAINCWHMNDHESAAMWKIYLKSNEGIAIQTTFNKLKSTLNDNEIQIFLGKVNYIDYETDIIKDWSNGFSPFVHKRKSFMHENELRAVIWNATLNKEQAKQFGENGIKVKIDLTKIIENVYVSPDSALWLTELVKDVCKKFNINVNVCNSRLNESPIF